MKPAGPSASAKTVAPNGSHRRISIPAKPVSTSITTRTATSFPTNMPGPTRTTAMVKAPSSRKRPPRASLAEVDLDAASLQLLEAVAELPTMTDGQHVAVLPLGDREREREPAIDVVAVTVAE